MLAAMPARQEGHADRQGRALAHSRRAGRLRVARHRRPTHLRRRQRRHPVRARRQDRHARCGSRTSARSRSRRRCSPTASSTSAPRTAKFYIIRPLADKAEILDQDWLGSEQNPEPIIAVARRRARPRLRRLDERDLRHRTEDGAAGAPANPATAAKPAAAALPAGVPAAVLVTPTELILKPGESIALTAQGVRRQRRRRRFARAARRGRSRTSRARSQTASSLLTPRPARRPAWSRPRSARSSARRASASSRTCRGASTSRMAARCRRRSGPTPPASSRSATSKAARCSSSWRRTTSRSPSAAGRSSARPDLSNYTIEADIRAMERRRQMGDIGIVAQRYELVLFGNHQELAPPAVAAGNGSAR